MPKKGGKRGSKRAVRRKSEVARRGRDKTARGEARIRRRRKVATPRREEETLEEEETEEEFELTATTKGWTPRRRD